MLSTIKHPAESHMVWQYHVVLLPARLTGFLGPQETGPVSAETCCNALGVQGWELVSVTPITDANGATRELRLFFKRQVDGP